MHTVGRIDREIYKCVAESIQTDEVIITDERVQHIMDRHPGDYERYFQYIPTIITDPDYIFTGNKPNTGVILKKGFHQNDYFQLILRFKTDFDDPSFKNSIITFLKISERTWRKYLRSKNFLYKKD